MVYKYNALSAPVAFEEIERKLPTCSMLCQYYGDCAHLITLQTVDQIQSIGICAASLVEHSEERGGRT